MPANERPIKMTMQTERRQYPRVEYRREIVAYAATQRLRLQTRDLGAGGIGVVPLHDEQSPLLSRAKVLRLNLPLTPQQTTTVDGLIVRRAPDGCYGVSFVRIPAAIRQQIATFVNQQLEEERIRSEKSRAQARRVASQTANRAVEQRDTPQTLSSDDEPRSEPRQERETYGRRRAKRATAEDRRAERSTPKVGRPRRVTPPTRKIADGKSDGLTAPDSLEALRRRWADDDEDEH